MYLSRILVQLVKCDVVMLLFFFFFYDNFTYMSNMFFQLLAWDMHLSQESYELIGPSVVNIITKCSRMPCI